MKRSIYFWSQQAACKGYLYLFYPHENERPQARERREAKAKTLCAMCPVFQNCRDYARENFEYGVWGGENEEDRYLAGYSLPKYIGAHMSRKVKRSKESV